MSAGYQALLDVQRKGLAAITAAAPDATTRAEGVAYLTRLSASIMERSLPAPSASTAAFGYNRFPMAGANPDCRMGQMQLDPQAHYLIEGVRHGADRIAFGLYTPRPGAGLDLDDYLNLEALELSPDGHFRLAIEASPVGAATSQSGRPLGMKATTRVLMVREIYRRRSAPRAEISVDRSEGRDRSAPPEKTASTETRLRATAAQIDALLHQYLHWSEVFARRPNEMIQMPAELDDAVRGDPETRYFSGYFDLGEGDTLEVEIPEIACDYWMIQANNHWLEPIADAHRNDATASPDVDGATRIRISASAGDRANWLHTRNRSRGTLLYRTIGAGEAVVPEARVVHP
ncbi:MAG: DUF1254 domain-containing protein [bacterium]|nr:hypothetical protein [Deltaproteobacteria bacterium]MCP4908939.1 DUF1254 domain-containing protein [bacterium]